MRGGHGTVDRQLIRAPVPLTFGGEDAVTLSGASARIALVAPAYPSPIFFASLWRPLALDPSANPRSTALSHTSAPGAAEPRRSRHGVIQPSV
ncbi:MAG: hypothetical protein M1370_05690 [Bacteroidetes bacterium]|nr:hypothetical protein [Bacteroidota bacterium]